MISAGGIKNAATYYQNSMQAVKKSDSVAKAKEAEESKETKISFSRESLLIPKQAGESPRLPG